MNTASLQHANDNLTHEAKTVLEMFSGSVHYGKERSDELREITRVTNIINNEDFIKCITKISEMESVDDITLSNLFDLIHTFNILIYCESIIARRKELVIKIL